MEERITPYLQNLIRDGKTAIEIQFKAVPQEGESVFAESDPLGEESLYNPVKGLVHKFRNRVLWKVSYRCAAHCQFCTRVRQIGNPEGDLTNDDIKRCLEYISSHPEVDDVILSGGDPFATPQPTNRIVEGLTTIQSVKVIRVDTRVPIQSPRSMHSTALRELVRRLQLLAESKAVYILVHVNHSDELTREARESLTALRKTGIPILSQTVFLKDVNDDISTLTELFQELYYLGVIPYYIYRCDYVQGLERFVCDLGKEREIMTQLRSNLSGMAVPTYVVDVAGRGKIPIPLKFWGVPQPEKCVDFDGKPIDLYFPRRK